MNSRQQRLRKLLDLARDAAPYETPVPETPPYGLATRVAARWVSRRRNGSATDFWLRACWWGFGGAAAICIATAAYQTSLPEPDGLDLFVDAVVETEPF